MTAKSISPSLQKKAMRKTSLVTQMCPRYSRSLQKKYKSKRSLSKSRGTDSLDTQINALSQDKPIEILCMINK